MSSRFKSDLSLKYYTTMHIGGIVKWAFFPVDREGVKEVFDIIKNRLKVPYFVLGRGSNVIINDQKLEKAAILTHYINHIEVKGERVLVGAGLPMSFLARLLLWKYSLQGLEFLYGLPGSIGGGAFMNARVFSKEIADFVEWVEVYDTEQDLFLKVPLEECAYGYKSSIFQKKPYFIVNVALKLKKVEDISPFWQTCRENFAMRMDKHQFTYPSCGSFYKNDRELGKPSGVLLDELGLKNRQVGDAKISEYHANFFVNPHNKATYQDMLDLKNLVDKITKQHGFTLTPEVHFIS